jgi:hypothetical protein
VMDYIDSMPHGDFFAIVMAFTWCFDRWLR